MRNGSRAARTPRRHRDARVGSFAYVLIIAGVLGGLLWIWQSAHNVRGGMVTMSCAMFAAALARLLLPESAIRLLASRKRLLDVTAFTVLGAALLVAGLIVPVPS